jgi:meso-butanediol dehydrogenase / (S,S)-butanediol dehydrogenase / diacetyl reductase
MPRFINKTIILTGAGSGIGAATLRRLVREGANVSAADVNKEQLDSIVAGLEGRERVFVAATDVSNLDQVQAFVGSSVERFGTPFGLVNCAGIRGVGTVLDFEPDRWRRVLAVNLDGTFFMCQAFARILKEAKASGAIVNISSGAGIRGVANRLAYVASKHAIGGITSAMALELAPLGIRVNAVAPGMIRTPMTAPMFEDPENVRRIRASHPIGREGEPEEIAGAIAYFLSDDASFVTGTVLAVDGGSTAGIPTH